jgi:nucleoside-diphosphate-sugar epimerase
VGAVLLTGHRGKIGVATEAALTVGGFTVSGFDLADGDDVRDVDRLVGRGRGASAIVHLAAMPNDDGPAKEVLDTNVFGTWAVLAAAERLGVQRVVVASSIHATGLFEDGRLPDYLPLDEQHPSYARSAYSTSKLMVESACESFTQATGIATVCLRPPLVLEPRERAGMEEELASSPLDWRWRSWCDIRDVADAAVRSLRAPLDGHHVVFVASGGVLGNLSAAAIAGELGVEWRGGTSLIDTRAAQRLLQWAPRS